MTVILTAMAGLWVSQTAHKVVVYYYYIIILPFLTIVLTIAGGISLGTISAVPASVTKAYPESIDTAFNMNLEFTIQTQLLVSGLLCCFVCLFQVVSIVSTRHLYIHMVKEENEGRFGLSSPHMRLSMERLKQRDAVLDSLASNGFSKQNILGILNFKDKRPKDEKWVIIWSILTGVFHIYFHGTFVVFSSYVVNNKEFWMNLAWRSIGLYDPRYVNYLSIYQIVLNYLSNNSYCLVRIQIFFIY